MMDARVGESMWRFRQNVNALVGHEVTVRSVLPAPSQWRGKLMRVAPEGLVIAGYGIVAIDWIEDVTGNGQTVRLFP
jgi:hypothetical protein